MSNNHWAQLEDDALLELKISKLNLKLDDTDIYAFVQQLYRELKEKGLSFLPPCFLADEWFTPGGVPAIGIPFYLAHERLKKLENKIILEVEGGTKAWFMQLIRHEAAHAYANAYRLAKKKKWQALFGLSSKPYLDTYRPRAHSRSYVIHLDRWYAQSHPDEDFAETFAVWLTPQLDWRKRYAGWKALRKLEYVDSLMKELATKEPSHRDSLKLSEHAGLNIKLKTFYARKKKLYEDSYPDFYDRDLRQLFLEVPIDGNTEKASRYLKVQRKKILSVAKLWTREKKYTINQFLDNIILRCDELNLYAKRDDGMLDLQVASYVTSMVMSYLFTGKFKRPK